MGSDQRDGDPDKGDVGEELCRDGQRLARYWSVETDWHYEPIHHDESDQTVKYAPLDRALGERPERAVPR
jgi:hypothetical protein